MSTYSVLDGTGALKYVYGLSTGTSGDPYRLVSKRYSNAIAEDGKVFIYTTRISMANGAVYNFLLKTPASPKFTLYEIICAADNSPVLHDLYEDAVVSANGTAVSVWNANRQSATAASSLLYTAPTVTSTGTLLIADLTTGGKAAGGVSPGEFRIIFKPSANYLLQLTNSSGAVAPNVAIYLKFSET